MFERLPVLMLALAGCLQDVGRGPDLGTCAEYPDGTYTWGEVGIGSCLSGPSDLAFIEKGGRTWLAISNADPFRSFETGGLLLVDFDSIDLTKRENDMSELVTSSLPLEPFVGGMGYDPDRELLYLSGRFSADAQSANVDDRVFVVDLADPEAPQLWASHPKLTVKADPFSVAVDPVGRRGFVLNLTDRSLSVLDLDAVEVVPLAPESTFTAGDLVDADGSGSSAVVTGTIEDAETILSETWTLSWIDGTYRLWVPEDDGLARHVTGLDGTYTASGPGVEISPDDGDGVTEITDPFLVTNASSGALILYFADQGVLRPALQSTVASSWSIEVANVIATSTGWDAWRGGPAFVRIDQDLSALFFDGRTAEGEPASIGVAYSGSSTGFVREPDPVVTAPGWADSVEDPFVRNDPTTDSLRMWMSVWDGVRWSIGLSESTDDGTRWTPVERVLSAPAGHVASPVVAWANGRYILWVAVGDGSSWAFHEAWSWDGRHWEDLHEVLPADVPFDLMDPPRLAIDADPLGSWRITGEASGTLDYGLSSGIGFSSTDLGFSLRVASGQTIDTSVVGDVGINGIEPNAFAEPGGVPTLYVTALDRGRQRSLAVLQHDGTEWVVARTGIIPLGDGDAGAESALVFGEDGDWTMIYTAQRTSGGPVLRRATSSDGLDWTVQSGTVLPASGEDWESSGRYPRSLEPLDGGQYRLWYTGYDGSRYRIGSAIGDGTTFSLEPGAERAYQFGTGEPGEFDDSGVRDPLVIVDGDTAYLLYSGFDGDRWSVGLATREGASGDWVRRTSPITGLPTAVLDPISHSFSANGVRSPVLGSNEDGEWEIWYAGTEGSVFRVGLAVGDERALLPAHEFPTAGDTLSFAVLRGGDEAEVIDLSQTIDGVATITPGGDSFIGDDDPTSAVYDPVRGFLYVTAKLASYVYVIDVRDDSLGDFQDLNYLDIEAILVVETNTGDIGFRDAIATSDDLLYLAAHEPDGIIVADLSMVEDNATKEAYHTSAIGALPLVDAADDAGGPTVAAIASARMALTPDERLLLVTQFRDNAVTVYDRTMGPWGEVVRHIRDIGENPYAIRVTPDGRWAVVANYVGEVQDRDTSSTLAVIDLDPASPTYLEVVTWLVNR